MYPHNGPRKETDAKVMEMLRNADCPLDCRTITAELGFESRPVMRHLFVCGMVEKVDRNGYKRSIRYRASANSVPVKKRR